MALTRRYTAYKIIPTTIAIVNIVMPSILFACLSQRQLSVDGLCTRDAPERNTRRTETVHYMMFLQEYRCIAERESVAMEKVLQKL